MNKRIRSRICPMTLVLLFGGPLAAQAQGTTSPGTQTPDKPSNGALELSAEPGGPRHPLVWIDPAPTDENGRQLWTGRVLLRLTNTTRGIVTVNDGAAEWFYSFEVLDSAGKLVPMTPLGVQVAARRTDTQSGFKPGSTLHLTPLESAVSAVDLALLFRVKVGYAYTIRIRRPLDSGTTDDKGKPLPPEGRELTYTLNIPGKNADQ
jgi:hypothetical protein